MIINKIKPLFRANYLVQIWVADRTVSCQVETHAFMRQSKKDSISRTMNEKSMNDGKESMNDGKETSCNV
jgi:hypothetical protein